MPTKKDREKKLTAGERSEIEVNVSAISNHQGWVCTYEDRSFHDTKEDQNLTTQFL
jgi:hypothetical protein